MAPREENVYMAKLAEQAERYEEMVEYMEKVSASLEEKEELSVEERNLLSVAYKNVIGARRASWRIISSIEQKEESRGNEDHVSTIKEYRSKIENELSKICEGILKLLDDRLIPSAGAGDSKVFYLKMKGDYHRYLAEFKTAAERKEAAESTLNAYKAAQVGSHISHIIILLLYIITAFCACLIAKIRCKVVFNYTLLTSTSSHLNSIVDFLLSSYVNSALVPTQLTENMKLEYDELH